MSFFLTVFNFIIAIPKIWAIFNEIVAWIDEQQKNKSEAIKQESRREIRKGITQKERENAADSYLDNLD